MASDLKHTLVRLCREEVDKRKAAIRVKLAMIEESRNNETKSSVGDKYETGRAMMQMEESKAQSQMHEVMLVDQVLSTIKADQVHRHGQQGSIIRTDHGVYFLAIGIGKVTVEGEVVYCVSMDSPIGTLFTGSQKGDVKQFRDRTFTVTDVE